MKANNNSSLEQIHTLCEKLFIQLKKDIEEPDYSQNPAKIIRHRSLKLVLEKYERILRLTDKVIKIDDYEVSGIVLRVLLEEALDIFHLTHNLDPNYWLRLLFRDWVEERNFLLNSRAYSNMNKDQMEQTYLVEDFEDLEVVSNHDSYKKRKEKLDYLISEAKKELLPKQSQNRKPENRKFNKQRILTNYDYINTMSEKLKMLKSCSIETYEMFKILSTLGNFHIHNAIPNIHTYQLKPEDEVLTFGLILIQNIRDVYDICNMSSEEKSGDFKMLDEFVKKITTQLLIYFSID